MTIGTDKHGRTIVRCYASSREYEVTFDREGLVRSVVNIGMYGNRRSTWYFMSDKPMGLTAKCAVHAAQCKLKEAKHDNPAALAC